jgi:Pentapeptide repeats (8 copies)
MFLLDSIFDKLVAPVIDRRLQALRAQKNFDSGRQYLNTGIGGEATKGLAIIRRLCEENPLNLQEYIDVLCQFVRARANPQENAEGDWNALLRSALLLICSLPRYDRNKWPYNIDLANIRLSNMGLQRLNLENAVLFDSVFHKVDFGRSSFRNCDLGGCMFEAGSSVEWCDFEGSLMNRSFLSGKITTFTGTRLWGCNLEKARIDLCRMQIVDGYNPTAAMQVQPKLAVMGPTAPRSD